MEHFRLDYSCCVHFPNRKSICLLKHQIVHLWFAYLTLKNTNVDKIFLLFIIVFFVLFDHPFRMYIFNSVHDIKFIYIQFEIVHFRMDLVSNLYNKCIFLS